MSDAHRLWRTAAARWWVALAAMLLGMATVQAVTPATAAADPAPRAAAHAAPRYLNLHQCVYFVQDPNSEPPLDSNTTILRGSAGGTHVSTVPETEVSCPKRDGWLNASWVSGVIALDLNAGRYLNLHQCAYYSVTYHEWFTTVLPSGAGGTNISNVPENACTAPPPRTCSPRSCPGASQEPTAAPTSATVPMPR